MIDKTFNNAFIYKIIFPNNKIYIGRYTSTLRHLIKRYTRSKNTRYVERAILKYGIQSVIFEIVEQFDSILSSELDLKEIQWIKYYNSTDHKIGYNILSGGKCNLQPLYIRQIISKKAKQRLSNPKNHPSYGMKRSNATKLLLSKVAKQRLSNPKNHPNYGRRWSIDTKLKMSLAKLGKYTKEKSYNWKGYLDKETLLECIKNNDTFLIMIDKLKTNQDIIERSLEFHFGNKSLTTIRNIFCLPEKEYLIELIKQGNTIRSFCKIGINQFMLEKCLSIYFNTTSLSQTRYLLGLDFFYWGKFNPIVLNITQEEIELENYILLNYEEINSWETPLSLKCPNNHDIRIYLTNWKKGNRCHQCFLEKRAFKTLQQLKNELELENYQFINCGKFTGKNTTKIEYICPNGHNREVYWKVWSQGHRCGQCIINSLPHFQTKKQQEFSKNILNILEKQMIEENYILLPNQIYVNCRSKLKYVCSNGHQKEINWNSWNSGHRCFICNHKIPNGKI